MADFSYDAGHEPPLSHSVASLANWAGAIASLAVVIGIGTWGYKMIARDVSGVPIVQAMEGPIRVAPDDPGGQLADHQGLSVNSVAGTGSAAEPPDALMLAPRPAGLSEEDVAAGALQEPQEPADAALSDAALRLDADKTGAADRAREESARDVDELVARLTEGAEPLSPLADDTTPPAAAMVPADAALGLARSLRPRLRPGGLQLAALTAITPAEFVAQPPEPTPEIDAATLPEGTRLVQIGAFDDPETARVEWARLSERFGDFLEGRARVIQRATSGGRTFYRLRAHGFEDLADARRFCAALVAGQTDCIPVVTR